MVRNILISIFLLCAFVAQGQTYGYMISKDRAQDADTANVLVMYPTGFANLSGRGHFVSYQTFASLISPYISIASKLNISDTSSMLNHYIERGDTSSMLAPYINRGDTLSMLSNYLLRSGAETLYGVKTFNSDPLIPDEAYSASWDGVLEPPTKNAVYDKIETVGSGSPTIRTISPTQITSDQDNYSPTGIGNASYIRLDGDNGIRAITGITDSIAGVLEKTLLNVGSYPIYLPMDHPDSDAAHRFAGYSGDYILYPGMSLKIWYDITSSKWRIIGETNSDAKTGLYYTWYGSSITSGDRGDVTIVTVSGANTATASTTSLPACNSMSTSTSSAAFTWMYFARTVITYGAFALSHNYTESLVSIPTLSDGTETYTAELQISNGVNSGALEANNTYGIRYSHGINSGKWELFSQSNTGTESVADLGVTVATGTLYKLRIEIDKSNSEARAYINDAYKGRVTATMANAVVCGSKIMIAKSAGTTARTLNVHSFSAGAIYP